MLTYKNRSFIRAGDDRAPARHCLTKTLWTLLFGERERAAGSTLAGGSASIAARWLGGEFRALLLHLTYATRKSLTHLYRADVSKSLRPQCRLSDPRQTVGLFVGPCPTPDHHVFRADDRKEPIATVQPARNDRRLLTILLRTATAGCLRCCSLMSQWLRLWFER